MKVVETHWLLQNFSRRQKKEHAAGVKLMWILIPQRQFRVFLLTLAYITEEATGLPNQITLKDKFIQQT